MRTQKNHLDQFYTNPEIAKILLSHLDLARYDLVVEPSAGSGAFSSLIPGCFAMDLDPRSPDIVQQDFLEYTYQGDVPSDRILCIGNPPFGRQGSLAIKFIKKCSCFADTIAFILPRSFNKPSMQDRLPAYFHLVHSEEVPPMGFLLDDREYDVPSIFQVWEKKDQPRENRRSPEPVGFSYVKLGEQADFSVRRVGFYAGKAYDDLNKCKESHYFIRLDNPAQKWDIIALVNQHAWVHCNTVGPRSVSKRELNEVIGRIIYG